MTASMSKQSSQASEQDVNAQSLANDLSAIYDIYTKFESNQKLKAENELKFSTMMQKIKNDQLQMLTLQKLQAITQTQSQ